MTPFRKCVYLDHLFTAKLTSHEVHNDKLYQRLPKKQSFWSFVRDIRCIAVYTVIFSLFRPFYISVYAVILH
jgi:hypothetical protein